MIFSKFTKPKWQHHNPDVRQSAVENLDDLTILNDVAQHDEAAEVRKSAVLKINDLKSLDQIAQHDTDSEVREFAGQRFQKLICCQDDNDSNLETSLTWINNSNDAEQLAYVAVHGSHIKLRKAAINKIEQEEVLGNIAINDPISEVRLIALEKLTQKSILERVAKVARNSDKRISRRAREKLDQVIEEMERPARVRAECETICSKLESLERRLNSEISSQAVFNESKPLKHAEFKRLQERWQTIATDADSECQSRFTKAQQAVQAAIENYQQALDTTQKREQALLPLRAAKKELCEQMEALLIDLEKRQTLSGQEAEEFNKHLSTLQSQWAEKQNTDDPEEEQQWQTRFEQATQSVQKQLKKLQASYNIANQLETICAQADALLNKTTKLKADAIKALNARWKKAWQQDDSLFSELKSRFENTLNALQTRLQDQKEQYAQATQELKQLLEKLDAVLEGGELKTAIPLEQQGRELLKNIDNFSTTTQKKTLERRLQACTAKINELRGWQRWGNKLEREKLCEQVENLLETGNPVEFFRLVEQAQTAWKKLGASGYSRELWERFSKACKAVYQRYREQLCLEMESLSGQVDDNPEVIAKMIRQAQATWKELGSQGHSQEVWERFNNACQTAYEPCRAHFNLKAKERQINFSEKEALCERLEAFGEETDWENADWKEVYRFVREQDKAWRNIGTTDRKLRKGIQRRFQTAMQVLETKLDEERQSNYRYRLSLMKQVEQVANKLSEFIEQQKEIDKDIQKLIETKINEAIDEVKQLQEEWQVTVPGNRRVEREFWNAFRGWCDVVFNHRKKLQDAHKKELQGYLKSKIVLCEQVEALSNSKGDAIKQAPAKIKTLKEEWKKINIDWNHMGNMRKKVRATEAVEERFEKACQQVERQYQAQLAAIQREQMEKLKLKAAFCVKLEAPETLAQFQEEPDWLSKAQAGWTTLPQLESVDLEAAIELRFQEACAAASSDSSSVNELTLKTKETLCIRMEILAGIESPPEAAQARLAYQVARLSAAMSGGERESREPQQEVNEIELSWYLTGIPQSDKTANLEQRFSKACEAFYSQVEK